jgi:hypothetical protein
MPDLPYQAIHKIEPDKKYTVMLTYLPLTRYKILIIFVMFVVRIMNQLKKSPGLVGYTLRAGIFNKKFYTLSIWQSEKDLRNFVEKSPHSKARTSLKGNMGKTAFHQWEIKGNLLPLSWDQALTRAKV